MRCKRCGKKMYRRSLNGCAIWMCLEPPYCVIYPDKKELEEWFEKHKEWK